MKRIVLVCVLLVAASLADVIRLDGGDEIQWRLDEESGGLQPNSSEPSSIPTKPSPTTTESTEAPITTTTKAPPEATECRETGPVAADPKDCRGYYSCMAIGSPPQHFLCGAKAHFDASKLRCVRGPCPPPTRPPGEPMPTPPPPPVDVACTHVGPVGGDPEDCHAYYSCLKIGSRPERFVCKAGFYFEHLILRCLPGDCSFQ